MERRAEGVDLDDRADVVPRLQAVELESGLPTPRSIAAAAAASEIDQACEDHGRCVAAHRCRGDIVDADQVDNARIVELHP